MHPVPTEEFRRLGEETAEAFWRSWDEFFAALRKARGRAARMQADGLTISQYQLLLELQEHPGARIGELAEAAGATPPTATRMLDSLERDGIVKRNRSVEDRRATNVALSAKGRRLLERKKSIVAEKRRALYDSLTEAERTQAERLLHRLAEAMEAL